MTAIRSTEESWVRKLEAVADGEDFVARARIFREVLAAAWTDGRERGYQDHRDDQFRADCARRQAEREATTEKEK